MKKLTDIDYVRNMVLRGVSMSVAMGLIVMVPHNPAVTVGCAIIALFQIFLYID